MAKRIKRYELQGIIVNLLKNEDPRAFDGVKVKDIKSMMLEKFDVTASDKMIIDIMKELTDFEDVERDGFVCGDDSVLVLADDHGYEESKLRGIHRYSWFNL